MTNFPMHFKATSQSPAGIGAYWVSRASLEGEANQTGDLRCSIPPEFGGPGSGASPEDFLALAMVNCYIATLKVIAENSKLKFDALTGSVNLTIEKDEFGVPGFRTAILKFAADGVADQPRFQRLMERVSKQCMVLNALKINIQFDLVARSPDSEIST